jgi:hypothetical protein
VCAHVHFADGLIKVLVKFCGQKLMTKKGDEHLTMYLVEERATTEQTQLTSNILSTIPITTTAPLIIHHGDRKHYTPVTEFV